MPMNLDSLILDSATPNQLMVFGAAGEIENFAGWVRNTYGGINTSLVINPDNFYNFYSFNNTAISVNPIGDSPDDTLSIETIDVQIDTDNDGFDFGQIIGRRTFIYHDKTSTGSVRFNELNGTFAGPVIEQIEYLSIFTNFFGGTQIENSLIGVNYAPNFDPSATFNSGAYSQAFNDTMNMAGVGPSHTTLNASPTFGEIPDNKNYTAVNINPTIPLFTGGGNIVGIGIYGQLGTFENGGFLGIDVTPNITQAQYATGLNVNMDNVTVFPGVPAEVTIQNINYEASQPGTVGNTVSFEYVGGGTAGSEVVSGSFPTFQVQIEDGVSTADQIKAALDAYGPLATIINTAIVGLGTTAQNIQAQTFLANGADPGSKRAAFLDGDVEITGNLTFGGALSIGQLNSFYMTPVIDNGGQPASLNSLISMPTVADNTTVNNADTIGLNTACLIQVGTNSIVNTGFLGISALALPAVAAIQSGAVVDRVAGATFALSLDGSVSAGGQITELSLCRALAIPNGLTNVISMYGYKMDLPFGNPASSAWGVYISPDINNYLAGDLKIGGTDTVANTSVGLELESTTKAVLLSRMSDTERDALTAIDGMMIYNTSVEKFQGYADGLWVDFH